MLVLPHHEELNEQAQARSSMGWHTSSRCSTPSTRLYQGACEVRDPDRRVRRLACGLHYPGAEGAQVNRRDFGRLCTAALTGAPLLDAPAESVPNNWNLGII